MRSAAQWLLQAVLLVSLTSGRASAQQATPLRTLDDLKAACRGSAEEGRRRLYAVELSNFQLGAYDAAAGEVEVDAEHNLRLFGGAAEIFTSALEPIAFTAGAERATELRRVAGQGATLRLGFFLGFDNPARRACLIRPAAGVTTARIDLAFVELVSADGHVLARQDTDRLRAWADDEERDGVPGHGPRAALGEASPIGAGAISSAWEQGLARANTGRLLRDLGRCHAAAVQRGAPGSAEVILRITLEGASGRVVESEVELSSLGDAEGSACVGRVVQSRLRLHADPSLRRLTLRLPVRLRAD